MRGPHVLIFGHYPTPSSGICYLTVLVFPNLSVRFIDMGYFIDIFLHGHYGINVDVAVRFGPQLFEAAHKLDIRQLRRVFPGSLESRLLFRQ